MATEEKMQELVEYATTLYRNNVEADEVKAALIRQGADDELAQRILFTVDKREKKSLRGNGQYMVYGGFVIVILCVMLLLGSYANTGSYNSFVLYILFGALGSVLFGGIDMMRGRSPYKRTKDPLATVKGKKTTEEVLLGILKDLDCTCKEEIREDEKKFIDFNFQGGFFRVIVISDSPTVEILFCHFFEAAMDYLTIIRYLCNDYNHRLRISKCLYTIDAEDNKVSVHCSTGSLLMDEIPNVKSYFTELLDLSFRIKNAFVQEFEEVKGESENLHGSVDTERMNSEKERETFLLREQEIYHQPENCQWRLQKTGKVCLNELLSTLFNLQKIELQKLVVVTDTMNVITSQEEGLALDLSSILIDKSEKGDCYFRHSHATVVIVYNDGCTITLDLKDEGLAGNSFYFRITACKSPKSIDRETTLNGGDNEADTRSVLVAYDSSSMEDKRAELKYMWQDAIDKVEEGKESELTDEQRLICNCTIADAAYNMYWGKKLSLNKRYFEALPHWENAFYALQGSFDDLTDSRKDDFYEVCYWAGFCHTELKQYQRAYYFLDILFSLNRVRYTEEYINALANSGDFRALNIIDNLLEHIDIGDVTDEKESRMLDFINFLRRRKGFVLVDLGKLDEAEKLFTSMLEESDNNDYALQELAYIRSLRKKDMGGN